MMSNKGATAKGQASFAFSAVIIYSIVHEGCHLLLGKLFGGRPSWHAVRWTVFSGEKPHIAFEHLPASVRPWMSAGGVLLPSLAGLALILLWSFVEKQARWWLQLLIVIPGLVLLLGNLGLFADGRHRLPLALAF
jgi:hypothetical protein